MTDLKEKLIELKKETDVQKKAQKLYNISEEGTEAMSQLFDEALASLSYVSSDIMNEAMNENLQSIKNKLEGITDFSANWYEDINGNFEDLKDETLNDLIEDFMGELN